MKVYLVGYMAVGKSTLGKRLSNALGLPFTDLDVAVEQQTGLSIPEIFASHGEAHFREMEHRALKDFAESRQDGLLSTGGGAPMHHGNMDLMLSTGTVLWLRLSPKMIVSRLLVKPHKRPLIVHLNADELLDYVIQHLEERSDTYSRAHLEVDAKSVRTMDIEACIERVRERG